MECDICGQDVRNSEDLEKHKELKHPAGRDDEAADDLEKPDLLGDTPAESAITDVPKPTH